eukprot:tig00021518_g22037.t1
MRVHRYPDAWLACIKASSDLLGDGETRDLILDIAASVQPSDPTIILRERSVQFLGTLCDPESGFFFKLAASMQSSTPTRVLVKACTLVAELARFHPAAPKLSQLRLALLSFKDIAHARASDSELVAAVAAAEEAFQRAQANPEAAVAESVRSTIPRAASSQILPTLDRLVLGEAALPVNLVNGPYRSTSDYLATHFHLIKALRSGNREQMRGTRVRSYERVSLTGIHLLPHGGGIVHRVRFSTRRNIDWSRTKWLVYGNLVVFSYDNYSSAFFAKIANRDIDLLSKGLVDIQFQSVAESSRFERASQNSSDRPGHMLESPLLFIAFEPILQSLKSLDLRGAMPFSDDIVSLRRGPSLGSTAPAYMTPASTVSLKVQGATVGPWAAAAEAWPQQVVGLFSPQQYRAVRLALRDRLAIIQYRKSILGRYPDLLDERLAKRIVLSWINCQSAAAARAYAKQREQRAGAVDDEGFETAGTRRARREARRAQEGSAEASSRQQSVPQEQQVQREQQAPDLPQDDMEDEDEAAEEAAAAANEDFFSESDSDDKDSQAESNSTSEEEALNEDDEVFEAAARRSGAASRNPKSSSNVRTRASNVVELDGEVDEDAGSGSSADDSASDSEEEFIFSRVHKAWSLSLSDRKILLTSWMSQREKDVREAENSAKETYQNVCRGYKQLEHMAKLDVLKKADVIGVTTTGCCIHADLLHHLKPAVVVCEEAAEILEGQLVAALTASTQHLVLVGDDEQLQPAVERYQLAVRHRLDVSMFQRLKQNGHEQVILTQQRRMRPEISELVRPIYPDLTNNTHVLS